ncbi:hypothetical protein PL9631_250024 [Planktothrix paucivesiculata PCC 9631]|uniref:Uncharacterized protein n=1 Tax=Planktothrix paucivesiculata PCC 9631 TaxID=671071 RepID=A0A7Z9BKZ4_9CYAN|nr:hypothetical protein PL9631_250024 [Planktothrix paucivesiculata PCC 9631]
MGVIRNVDKDEVDAIAQEDYAVEVAAIIQSSMRWAMRQLIHSIPVDEGLIALFTVSG